MSLINQMLQDLEQRHVGSGKPEPLAGEVRVASPVLSSTPWVLYGGLALLLGVIVIGASWLYLQRQSSKPSVAVVAPAAKPAPAAVPVPVQPDPALAPALPAEPVPTPSTVDVTPATVAPVGHIAGLDTDLNTAPSVEMPKAKTAKAKPAVAPTDVQVASSMQVTDIPVSVEPKSQSRPKPDKAMAPLKSVSPAQISENFYRQSMTALQQGRVVEAQDGLRKALDANPNNLKARQTLVGLMVEGRRHDEAIALLKDGLALAPEQTGFSMALARLQLEAGDRTSALNVLEQASATAGEDADFNAFYAALLQRDERHDEAVQHYLVALKSNPAMPNWLVGIGISLQRLGKNADATAAYQRARDTGQLTPQLVTFVDQQLRQLKP